MTSTPPSDGYRTRGERTFHLVGREVECARIERLLTDARGGRSGAIVLIGDAGVGKSALCSWAAATAVGMSVVRVRGVESEADLPFAGIAELCAGREDLLAALTDPQARVLAAAFAGRTLAPADRSVVGAAVLSLLAAVCGRRAGLVIVDDAQWLDGSSADALLFAARRLRHEGVVMLITTGQIDFDRTGTGLPHLTVAGLADEAARRLLDATHPDLDDSVARRLVDNLGGNPLALLEVPRHDRARGRRRCLVQRRDRPPPRIAGSV